MNPRELQQAVDVSLDLKAVCEDIDRTTAMLGAAIFISNLIDERGGTDDEKTEEAGIFIGNLKMLLATKDAATRTLS